MKKVKRKIAKKNINQRLDKYSSPKASKPLYQKLKAKI
jgi:hypothetical protein